MVRIARDLVQIAGEIIVEKFDKVTMIEMSQTQLPTEQMQQAQAMQVQQQMQNQQMAMEKMQMLAQSDPKIKQMAEQKPEMAQQLMQQGQQMLQAGQDAIKKIIERPNIEQVFHFLKSNRIRSFVLDIETDSTIQIDENAEKQRTTEFMQVLGGTLQQLSAFDRRRAEVGEVLRRRAQVRRPAVPRRARARQLDRRAGGDAGEQGRPAEAGRPDHRGDQGSERDRADQAGPAAGGRQGDVVLKQQELQMRDQHEQAKIASNERSSAPSS